MVLGKLPVPGRPTSLDKSRARAYCSCSRCGWGLFGHFYSHLSSLSSFTTRYRLKYYLKGSLSPKTTNQPKSDLGQGTETKVVGPHLMDFRHSKDDS